VSLSGYAQSNDVEYFMTSSYTKQHNNPAFRPEKGYIGIPGLTNFQVGYQTNTFNLDHFLFPGKGEDGKAAWFLNKNVGYDEFMSKLADRNYLNLNINETLLGFGFYAGKLFLFVDAGVGAQAEVEIPKEMFRFLKNGIALGDNEMETYNIDNVTLGANAYGKIGIGASYPLLDNTLQLGFKVNVLLGLAGGNVNFDQMQLNIGRNEWILRSHATAQFRGMLPKYDEDGKWDGGIDADHFGINGTGLGLDIGAIFRPGNLKNLSFSFSLTDLGHINWNKTCSANLATNSTEIPVIGHNEISFESDSESFDDILTDLEDNMKEIVAFRDDPANTSTSSSLRARMNLGVEYRLLGNHLNVGALLRSYFNRNNTITEFVIGSSYRPGSAVELGVSYSLGRSVGCALHLGPGFFISTDYLFPHYNSWYIPTTSKGVNVQLGFVVPIGKKHKI
jgi:hypothetical protein